jgi:hypothetical protein
VPNEGELFYGLIQDGNDLWNATFFCGSCAVLRRTICEEVGGIAVETVTEDAHTALKMHRLGYNTAYLALPQAAGLATESLSGHVGQRIRWARGMAQIFRIDNPLFGRGLQWAQRLCYVNAMLHFLYGLPRLIYLTAPLAYLFFGASVIHASASMIFAYALPHIFHANLTNSRIQGRFRYLFWNEVYEAVLAWYIFRPTLVALINPKLGSFNVTAKGGLIEKEYFDTSIAKASLFLLALNFLGVAAGLWRLTWVDSDNIATVWLNLAWTFYNLVILGACVAAANETRQLRNAHRIALQIPATLYFADGHSMRCETYDFSTGGLGPGPAHRPDGQCRTRRSTVALYRGDTEFRFPGHVRFSRGKRLGLQFAPLSFDEGARTGAMHHGPRRHLGRALGQPPARRGAPRARPHRAHQRDRLQGHVRPLLSRGTAEAAPRTLRRRRPAARRQGTHLMMQAAPLSSRCRRRLAPRHRRHAGPAGLGRRRRRPGAGAAPAPPKLAATAPAAGRAREFNLTQLGLNYAVQLRGVSGTVGIPFSVRADELVTSAALRLNYAYSPSLIPELSHLKVSVNDVLVATLALPREGAGKPQTADIPIDRRLITDFNRINVELVGHYTRECEDPQHSSLWAKIDASSTLRLSVSPLKTASDLAVLPQPFFDRRDVRRANIPFVFGGTPSRPRSRSAGIVSSWFGALAGYRGATFPVSNDALPAGNAVVFATPETPSRASRCRPSPARR